MSDAPPTAAPAGAGLTVLLDANVILDVLADREPWARDAARLLSAVELRHVRGAVAAHTVTTLYYLLAKAIGREAAVVALLGLLRLVEVAPVDGSVLLEALALGLRDVEDAVQAVCAVRFGADVLVTRNARGFAGAGVPTATPGEVLARL